MPTWARAIIFGLELVGFLIICIVMTYKYYKKCELKNGKMIAIKCIKENAACFAVFYAVVLGLFLFTYPTLTFLSFDKMLMVGIFVIMFSLTIISCFYLDTKKENFFVALFSGVGIVFLILFALMSTKMLYIGY